MWLVLIGWGGQAHGLRCTRGRTNAACWNSACAFFFFTMYEIHISAGFMFSCCSEIAAWECGFAPTIWNNLQKCRNYTIPCDQSDSLLFVIKQSERTYLMFVLSYNALCNLTSRCFMFVVTLFYTCYNFCEYWTQTHLVNEGLFSTGSTVMKRFFFSQ